MNNQDFSILYIARSTAWHEASEAVKDAPTTEEAAARLGRFAVNSRMLANVFAAYPMTAAIFTERAEVFSKAEMEVRESTAAQSAA